MFVHLLRMFGVVLIMSSKIEGVSSHLELNKN